MRLRLSPKPPQASISRHMSAHTSVLASVAFRPRWLTPRSTKLLSVTYRARVRVMLLGCCVRYLLPTRNAEVCVLSLVS